MSAAATDGGAQGWRVVAGAFLGLATGPNIVLLLVFGVFLPQLRSEFGWGIGEISLGATIICLSLAVASPLQGWVVDRFGARLPILVSLPVFGLALCSMSMLGPDVRVFRLACGLLEISALGAWSVSYITLVTTWFDRRLGLALGVSQLGAGLGGGVLPVLLAFVFASAGWRAGYLALGLAQFAIWPVAFVTARERPVPTDAGSRAVQRPGLPVGQAVLLISSIAGRLLAAWALDRVPLAVFMPALLALTACACAAYAGYVGTAVLVGSAIVMGLAIGAEFDVLGYAIGRYFGMASFGMVFGLVLGCFQAGGGIGAALVGVMRERSGSYVSGLWTLAAVSLATAVLLAGLRRYRFAPAAEPLSATGG